MARQFLDTLRDIRQGAVIDELGEELAELVQAVRETGRRGELTFTLTVRPASKGNVDVLALEDSVKVKRPKPERGTSIVYAQPDGSLSRRDPRQPEMTGLRTVTSMPAKEGIK